MYAVNISNTSNNISNPNTPFSSKSTPHGESQDHERSALSDNNTTTVTTTSTNNNTNTNVGDSNHRSPQHHQQQNKQEHQQNLLPHQSHRPSPPHRERAGDERIERVFIVYDEQSSPCPGDSPINLTNTKEPFKPLPSPTQTSLLPHSLSFGLIHTPMSQQPALRQSTQQKQLTRTINNNNNTNNNNASSNRTFTQPR